MSSHFIESTEFDHGVRRLAETNRSIMSVSGERARLARQLDDPWLPSAAKVRIQASITDCEIRLGNLELLKAQQLEQLAILREMGKPSVPALLQPLGPIIADQRDQSQARRLPGR